MHTEVFYSHKPEAKKVIFLCNRKPITSIDFYVCVEVQSFT